MLVLNSVRFSLCTGRSFQAFESTYKADLLNHCVLGICRGIDGAA